VGSVRTFRDRQLFALVSPLFSQVVIDKVLVHRGLTTLNVLVFGLVTVSMFESLHGGLIGAAIPPDLASPTGATAVRTNRPSKASRREARGMLAI
jgi:hypothetical protein